MRFHAPPISGSRSVYTHVSQIPDKRVVDPVTRPPRDKIKDRTRFLGGPPVTSKILHAVAAIAIACAATPADAAKAKAHKHHGHHKAHTVKGWKKCKAPFKYLKGGKCLDARDKKAKS